MGHFMYCGYRDCQFSGPPEDGRAGGDDSTKGLGLKPLTVWILRPDAKICAVDLKA